MGTDYDSNGFKQGDDGAIYGDPTATGSISDYDSWDWKQIEAAIRGMSAGTSDADNLDHAASVASPQSLQDAANVFYHVQVVLSGVAQALHDQAKALAGSDGPWKGDAADAFYDMMDTFSKQVAATSDVLSGGKSADGGTGSGNSVPQQLADNAVNLQNAQNKIGEIDAWYAHQATLMGVTPMSNGLIPVSKKPEIVKMLNHDMRQVLKNLAADYQVTVDSVRPPGSITGPSTTDQPPVDQPPPDDTSGQYQAGDITPADVSPLDYNGGALASRMPDDALSPTEGFDPATYAAANPYSGSLDTNGPGSGLGGDGDVSGLGGLGPDGGLSPFSSTMSPAALDRMLNPDAFSGGTGVDGPGGLGDDSGLGGLGGTDPRSLARTADPAPFAGDTGLGGDGGLGGLPLTTPNAFRGGTGLDGNGLLPESDLAEDPSTWKDGVGAADFPGDTGIGGTSGLADDLGLGDGAGLGGLGDTKGFSPTAFPGSTSTTGAIPGAGDLGLESELPGFTPSAFPGTTGLSANPAGLAGTPGGGMPFMPGMGGAAQSAQGGSERSDASGLLDPTAEPWTGDAATAGEGLLPAGGVPVGGGEGLDLPGYEPSEFPGSAELGAQTGGLAGSPGGGMPFMPGMGGAAQSAQGGSERSDASGLLDPTAEPWTGDAATAGEGLLPAGGVPVGGEGLDLPGYEPSQFPGTAELGAQAGGLAGSSGSGMPFMPGMGGAAQSAPGGSERSDASGLLDPTAEPWTGEGEPAYDGEAAAGTVPGGQGSLDLPGGLPEESEAVAGGGVPGMMMPGAGGLGAGGAGREEGVASDASGLLAPSAEPWTEPAAPDAETPGATPAGAGTDTLSGSVAGAEPGVGTGVAPAVAAAPGASGFDGTGGTGGTDGTDGGFAVPADAEAPAAPAATPFMPMGGMPAAGGSGRGDEDDRGTLVEPTAEEFAEPAAPEALAADALAAGISAPAAAQGPATTGAAAAGQAPAAVPAAPESRLPAHASYEEPAGAEPANDPLVVLRPADDDLSEDDAAAWGVAGASLVPLLWAARPEEEGEITAPGYATADEGTWGTAPAAGARAGDGSAQTQAGLTAADGAPDGADEGRPLATWRPQRPTASGESAVPAVSEPLLSCAPDAEDEEWDEEEPEASAPEEPADEEGATRGIADLLVQEGDTWGSAPAPGGPEGLY
ncbi:WXG100 family type VII secretion target [Actinacidiphila sp. DG2A-62]|uniref:WXG100 family type VII secretion target n=1 Tax=Actinacidiphila sp. DG2A-62 TaxID=3108821 RepID=UPI002DBA6111|nr:WXG100 family type VII secretion target [Actinacidiphila sp. DG2A-62]MEC3997658.1 WXG100 family type VII secretion target [Actinacidiphila sp. DG2A-62]